MNSVLLAQFDERGQTLLKGSVACPPLNAAPIFSDRALVIALPGWTGFTFVPARMPCHLFNDDADHLGSGRLAEISKLQPDFRIRIVASDQELFDRAHHALRGQSLWRRLKLFEQLSVVSGDQVKTIGIWIRYVTGHIGQQLGALFGTKLAEILDHDQVTAVDG